VSIIDIDTYCDECHRVIEGRAIKIDDDYYPYREKHYHEECYLKLKFLSKEKSK